MRGGFFKKANTLIILGEIVSARLPFCPLPSNNFFQRIGVAMLTCTHYLADNHDFTIVPWFPPGPRHLRRHTANLALEFPGPEPVGPAVLIRLEPLGQIVFRTPGRQP